MSQNKTAISTAISYSYITFIDHYMSVLKNPMLSSFKYLDEETAQILAEMNTLFETLPSLVGSDEEFKQSYIEKLVDFRGTLENKYQALSAYKREMQHLNALMTLEQGVDHIDFDELNIDLSEVESMDFDALSKDCTRFVFSGVSNRDKQMRAAALLPFIPIRMTKDTFLTYTERSIGAISIEDTKEDAILLTAILRQLLDGKLALGYGEIFGDFKESLIELSKLSDYDTFFEEAELIDETIDSALDIVDHLYRMICTFSNLLIFDALTFEMLTDMHPSYGDFYYSIRNIVSDTNDSDLFLETLPERVMQVKDEVHTNYEKHCSEHTLDPLLSLINLHLVMDVSHVFGFDTNPHAKYSKEVMDVFKDFMAELKEYLEATSPKERKLRMQYFISVIPFIMSDVNFEDYTAYGFKNVSSPKRNVLTAMQLSQTLEENGYFEQLEEANHAHTHDHQHEHGEHCTHDH